MPSFPYGVPPRRYAGAAGRDNRFRIARTFARVLRQSEGPPPAWEKLVRKAPLAGIPAALHGKPLALVVYMNLPLIATGEMPSVLREESLREIEENTTLALEIDLAMREKAPAGWKEDSEGPRGKQVLNALFPLMKQDRRATLALFELIKNQPGN